MTSATLTVGILTSDTEVRGVANQQRAVVSSVLPRFLSAQSTGAARGAIATSAAMARAGVLSAFGEELGRLSARQAYGSTEVGRSRGFLTTYGGLRDGEEPLPSSAALLPAEWQALAEEFGGLVVAASPASEVYASVVDGVLDLWVVLPEEDDHAERKIAEAACEMMRAHPSRQFDFMVAIRGSRSADFAGRLGFSRV